jgi:hypothetical protein
MNLLDMILNTNDGALVRQTARSLGIDESQARDAVRSMAPALSRGIQRNLSQPDGLESLLSALKSGNHQRYVDHAEELERSEAIADGNAILGHILHSKDASRNVAGRAAAETGLDAGLMKRMLPMVAAMAMGSLGKEATGGGLLSALGGGPSDASGALGVLESFLDADRDGAVLDDVLDLAKKFL